MNNKIQMEHRQRKAIVYLRQSSISQVKHNRESQRLQYALATRARALGFANVSIIDTDLGISAATGSQRPGFQQLLAEVALGDVGIIFSRELSRLSRTDKDWCHLMEICQLFNTLIGDDDSIYDPSQCDDQLVLGIKGTLSVAELNVIRLRLLQGKEAKAKRGELFGTVAPGYIRDGDSLVKDPNCRIQEAIALVFAKFLEVGSIRQTYAWFLHNNIELPANKGVNGTMQIVWKLPAQTYISGILHNPVYAGAYAYGRRPVEKVLVQGIVKKRQRSILTPEDTRILLKDRHEGYISWETYERVQAMIANNGTNFQADESILAVREGAGLLTGLLRCGRCGHKLQVRYWGRQGTIPRYLCYGSYNTTGSYCIGFGGKTVDQRIGDEVCQVLSPAGTCASLLAIEQISTDNDDHLRSLQRQRQQVEYEAKRAFAQYDQVDPNNRLVAQTLEQRWNEKLEAVNVLEQTITEVQSQKKQLTEKEKQTILALGNHFQDTWQHPDCPMTLKKRLVRALIKEIVADVDEEKQQLRLIIHWQGGDHSSITMPRPLSANKAHKTAEEDCELIRKMAVRYSDSEIAQVLSKHGRKTGKGNRWTKSSVGIIRRKLGIKPASNHIDDGVLNLAQARRYYNVSDSTLLKLIEYNILPANQIVPFAPYEIKKSDLESEPVAGIIRTLKTTGKLVLGVGTLENQKELFVNNQ